MPVFLIEELCAFSQQKHQTHMLVLQGSAALVECWVCSSGTENQEMFQEVLSEHLHSAGDIYHKKEMSFLGLTLALPGKDQLSQKDGLPLWQNHNWNYPALS